MICTTLPFGTTCATSLSLTVSFLPFSGATRRFSNVSGLKRPPARSFERSLRRRSIDASISASSTEKSKGSSLPEDAAAILVAGGVSLAALPPFL